MEWIPVWTLYPITKPLPRSTSQNGDEPASCSSNASFQELILEKMQRTQPRQAVK